jgi:hypothetical protein
VKKKLWQKKVVHGKTWACKQSREGASRTQEKREAGSQAGAVYILYRYVYVLYKG